MTLKSLVLVIVYELQRHFLRIYVTSWAQLMKITYLIHTVASQPFIQHEIAEWKWLSLKMDTAQTIGEDDNISHLKKDRTPAVVANIYEIFVLQQQSWNGWGFLWHSFVRFLHQNRDYKALGVFFQVKLVLRHKCNILTVIFILWYLVE